MILGLVKWMQPVHGYDVRRELLSWDADKWANVAPGSIYHALRKLTEEGLLEEVGTEQVDGRPARTLYRTTRFGREEFERLLRNYWWERHHPIDPFFAAVSFLPSLPRREAVLALRNRAAVLRGFVDLSRSMAEQWQAEKPVHVSWLMELRNVRAEAEIGWCEQVAARVEAGAGEHEDDPGQPLQQTFAAWRAELES
jgi:DNA-binding PadR family transcriptional regulator